MDVKTIAILGGAFDSKELGDNDIACVPGALEALQLQHVTGSDDVQPELVERSHVERLTAQRDALQNLLNARDEEVSRLEGLWVQQLSQKADIGVDLAVSIELLRKSYLAMLKADHSKPLRQQIRELLREDLPDHSINEGINISEAPEGFRRPSAPPKAPPKPNCRACEDTGCPDCY